MDYELRDGSIATIEPHEVTRPTLRPSPCTRY
jgi:hypothetical protein